MCSLTTVPLSSPSPLGGLITAVKGTQGGLHPIYKQGNAARKKKKIAHHSCMKMLDVNSILTGLSYLKSNTKL